MKKIVSLCVVLISSPLSALSTYPYPTIDTPGFYRLASNVSNQIIISSGNVTLDMNGCIVSGGNNGLVINAGLSNVTIKNGTVSSVTSDGIQVNGGCTNIMLDSITVRNAMRAISCNNVTNGLIANCDLLLSNTGVELQSCHNITLENCSAMTNKYAGFSLISSTTCSLLDCKAISTGQGNTDLFGNIYGFVNNGGQGNIFQRCIANATQGLTLSATQSVVAGFALLGTGTQCHTIMDCEAGNSTTSPNGYAEPYGIFLGETLDALTIGGVGASSENYTGLDVSWSSDGAYFAVAGGNLSVYSFDRTSTFALRVATTATASRSVDWNPGSDMIAVGGTAGSVFLYSFDRLNYDLSLRQTALAAGNVEGVAWSPDGKFLATANRNNATPTDIYRYNAVQQFLTLTQVYNFGAGAAGATGVSWSPDGSYIAFTGNTRIEVASFNASSGAASLVASATPTASGGKSAWSPEGNYIAVIGATAANTSIYQFNGTSLTLKDTQDTIAGSTNDMSLAWSPDTRYLTTTNDGATAVRSRVYSFDKGTGKLTLLSTLSYVGLFNTAGKGCDWSPDGGYIVLVGQGSTTLPTVYLLNAIQFPAGNMIVHNSTYCNSGNAFVSGTGISGSSITNYIIDNTSYNNPFNYIFVQNAFNQLFGEGPSALQNIEVDKNVPILTPINIPLSVDRTRFLLQSLVDDLL